MTQYKKENVLPGIEDKVVVITGASSGIGEATRNRTMHALKKLRRRETP